MLKCAILLIVEKFKEKGDKGFMRSYHWMLLLGVALIIVGVYQEELAEILANAEMICFSCIGLG